MNIKELQKKKIDKILTEENKHSLVPKVAEKLAVITSLNNNSDYKEIIDECIILMRNKPERAQIRINNETMKKANVVAGALNVKYNTNFSATSLLQTVIYQFIVEDINERHNKRISNISTTIDFNFEDSEFKELKHSMYKRIISNSNYKTLTINKAVIDKLIDIHFECISENGDLEAINFKPQKYIEDLFDRKIAKIHSSIKSTS